MATALSTRSLSKTYKGRKGRSVEALRGLTLDVDAGEVFGFLGPNGAGKSTTIKLLMGLIRPTSGSFSIKGLPGRSDEYRRMIGYLPENPSFYDYLTGEELLSFVGRVFRMSDASISIESERLLKLLDLHEARKRPIRSYSKGMVQRLGLAQCLLHDPEIFVLDEPMSGLDPLGRMLVRDIILDLKGRGKCVFMSTHILNDVETICDRVGIIVKGELRLVEALRDIMNKAIRGYDITFNTISTAAGDFLAALEGVRKSAGDDLTYYVPLVHFTDTMSRLSGDRGTALQVVEPVRKGLEELFAELAHESRVV